MLSQGAFNALLKTLEEPPAHVIFILCTTELQKVLPTIQSRCQRFDFKSISTNDIITKLKEIIESEKIQIEEDAIKQISTYAEGGLRDAISLLDQVYAYNPEKILLEDVNQICGAISMRTQIDLAQALIDFDSTKAIELLKDLLAQGKEVKKITLNLIEFFRDALMFSNLRKLDDASILQGNQDFQNIAGELSNRKAFYIIDVLSKALNEINWSNNPKIHLELAFLKIADNEDNSNSNVLAAIDEVEKRLHDLEKFKEDLEKEDKLESKEIIEKIIINAKKDEDEEEVKEEAKPEEEIDDNLFNVPEEEDLPVYQEAVSEDIVLESKEEEETLTEEENVSEDNSLEIEEPIKEPVVENETPIVGFDEEVKEDLCSDISKTYDIHFVEEVLNNGDKKDKITLQNNWNSFPEVENEDDSKYLASLIETGMVTASSIDKIIITFASTTICNTLMMPTNKEVVMKIINKKFNRIINYMALPTSVFTDISREFLDRYRKGEVYVKLSKIVCEGLKDVSRVEKKEVNDSKPKIVQDAIRLFGDKVKVKE
jgi:DNA polymerase-3 subunit gamma/tau